MFKNYYMACNTFLYKVLQCQLRLELHKNYIVNSYYCAMYIRLFLISLARNTHIYNVKSG